MFSQLYTSLPAERTPWEAAHDAGYASTADRVQGEGLTGLRLTQPG